jgi:hypothetical protein
MTTILYQNYNLLHGYDFYFVFSSLIIHEFYKYIYAKGL